MKMLMIYNQAINLIEMSTNKNCTILAKRNIITYKDTIIFCLDNRKCTFRFYLSGSFDCQYILPY